MNEMDNILWSIYITEYNVFSTGTTTRCYNFRGTKKDLMCLIGVIHSLSIVQCRVSYFPNRKTFLCMTKIYRFRYQTPERCILHI